MNHRTGMTELRRPFIPDQRGLDILGNPETVFEHAAEIVPRAGMTALGRIQIVFYGLQSLAPERQRPRQQKHESRIGRIASQRGSARRLGLRRIDFCGCGSVQASGQGHFVIEPFEQLRAFKARSLCAADMR